MCHAVSATPGGPVVFVKVPGDGVKRTVPVAGPGVYQVQAASVISGDQGTWFGPINVTVK
jgi:hypothetical protein